MAAIKPGKIARQRREFGERREKTRDRRPEVLVQPLEGEEGAERALTPEKGFTRPVPSKESKGAQAKASVVSPVVPETTSRPKKVPPKPAKAARPAARPKEKPKPKKKPEVAPKKPSKPAQKSQVRKKPSSEKSTKSAKKK
jgi:hypothetical protein